MFREVDKFLLLFALSLAFFVGFAASGLGRYLAKTRFSASVRRGVPVLLVCVLVLSSSYPYLSGDMGGAVKTVEVPEAYQLLDEWLTVQPETFRIAFFPPAVWATTYNWSSDWFLDPAVSLQSQPTLEVRSEMDLTSAASFSRWVYTQLYSHKVSEWGKFLALLGVEYVVVRLDADMPSYRNDLAGFSSGNTLAVLAAQKDFVLEKDFGAVKVYRNIHTLPHVYGAESFSVVAGDRRMLLSLANSDFNFRCYPAVFLDDAVDVSEVLIKNSGCLISQGDSYWSLIAASLGSKHIVEPWLYAPVSSNPWGRWVSGDLMWPFWGGALNVAVDGYIYSEGAANITIPLNVAAPGDYRVLAQVYVGAFPVGSNGVRFLSEGTGTVDYLFRTVRSTEGAYQWVDLGVSYFDCQSELTLCNLGGAAAVSKIAVLPVDEVEVATQNLLCMFEGCGADLAYVFDDFSWNYNVKAVVHNPLAGDGRLINLQKSGANTTFYVFKEDTYTLHSRFLLPDASVTVNVKVDEASSSVALASGGDDLVAVDLGCYYLGVGWHTLSLASSEDARLDLALLFTSPDMFNASGGAVASNFTMMSGSEYRVLVDGKNVVFLEGGYGYWQLYGDLEDAVVSVPVFNYGTIFLTGNEGNEYTLKYTGIDYVAQGVLAAFTALTLLFLGLNFSPNKWFISPIRRETQFMES